MMLARMMTSLAMTVVTIMTRLEFTTFTPASGSNYFVSAVKCNFMSSRLPHSFTSQKPTLLLAKCVHA